jgi:glutamate N-acetyltransferase / amino-acid N-acetyltransferase
VTKPATNALDQGRERAVNDEARAHRAGLAAPSKPKTRAGSRNTGVTAPVGFLASSVACGIRRARPDLSLIVSDRPCSAAAVFTRNLVVAAPIVASREALRASGGFARAIVVNSGNANACTGDAGLAAARDTARAAARLLQVDESEVLVASTGVIGQRLPVERLLEGLPGAVATLSVEGGADAANAILTTDTRTKESVRRVTTARGTYTIGGMAKGSGMIHPDMATTLAFLTTDAAVAPPLLQRCLSRATDLSFNRMLVDGDTSTNDMIALLANGASGVPIEGAGEHGTDAGIRAQEVESADVASFQEALTGVLIDLARDVARDGEGATKLITIEVTGARSDEDALRVGRTIAGSPLVKTAVHGADANWGRIVAAAGRAGVPIDPARLRVALCGLEVLAPGFHSDYSEADAHERLLADEITIAVDLGLGSGHATLWTCDFSAEYVAINASYRS